MAEMSNETVEIVDLPAYNIDMNVSSEFKLVKDDFIANKEKNDNKFDSIEKELGEYRVIIRDHSLKFKEIDSAMDQCDTNFDSIFEYLNELYDWITDVENYRKDSVDRLNRVISNQNDIKCEVKENSDDIKVIAKSLNALCTRTYSLSKSIFSMCIMMAIAGGITFAMGLMDYMAAPNTISIAIMILCGFVSIATLTIAITIRSIGNINRVAYRMLYDILKKGR